MEYAFVFGPVAVTVEACTCPEGDLEAGARIELRRVRTLPGNRDGNEGFSVLPRALLLELGAGDIVDEIDYDEVTRALPAIRAAIDACLVET